MEYRPSQPRGAREEDGFAGLQNQGATCYMNSLLQTLFMTPEFRKTIFEWTYDPEHDGPRDSCIPLQLQVLFAHLQFTKERSLPTRALTESFGWTAVDSFRQHDVQELARVLLDALERSVAEKQGKEAKERSTAMFRGVQSDFTRCNECNDVRYRQPTFMDLQLDIQPFGYTRKLHSIEESLQHYCRVEDLGEENKVHCERCGRNTLTSKGTLIRDPPSILHLQLKRFTLDMVTLNRVKLHDKVEFPFFLDLNPFVARTDGAAEAVAQRHSPDHGDGDATPAKEPSAGMNGSGEKSEDTTGKDSAMMATTAAGTMDPYADPVELVRQRGPYMYELYAVLIHSGGAGGGHYYAYIKNLETGRWFNFNDSTVSRIDPRTVCSAFGGLTSSYASGSSSAYMLAYRRVDAAAATAVPPEAEDDEGEGDEEEEGDCPAHEADANGRITGSRDSPFVQPQGWVYRRTGPGFPNDDAIPSSVREAVDAAIAKHEEEEQKRRELSRQSDVRIAFGKETRLVRVDRTKSSHSLLTVARERFHIVEPDEQRQEDANGDAEGGNSGPQSTETLVLPRSCTRLRRLDGSMSKLPREPIDLEKSVQDNGIYSYSTVMLETRSSEDIPWPVYDPYSSQYTVYVYDAATDAWGAPISVQARPVISLRAFRRQLSLHPEIGIPEDRIRILKFIQRRIPPRYNAMPVTDVICEELIGREFALKSLGLSSGTELYLEEASPDAEAGSGAEEEAADGSKKDTPSTDFALEAASRDCLAEFASSTGGASASRIAPPPSARPRQLGSGVTAGSSLGSERFPSTDAAAEGVDPSDLGIRRCAASDERRRVIAEPTPACQLFIRDAMRLRLRVALPKQSDAAFEIYMDERCTVADLKEAIAQKSGLTVGQFRAHKFTRFGTMMKQNDDTLSDAGLRSGDMIVLDDKPDMSGNDVNVRFTLIIPGMRLGWKRLCGSDDDTLEAWRNADPTLDGWLPAPLTAAEMRALEEEQGKPLTPRTRAKIPVVDDAAVGTDDGKAEEEEEKQLDMEQQDENEVARDTAHNPEESSPSHNKEMEKEKEKEKEVDWGVLGKPMEEEPDTVLDKAPLGQALLSRHVTREALQERVVELLRSSGCIPHENAAEEDSGSDGTSALAALAAIEGDVTPTRIRIRTGYGKPGPIFRPGQSLDEATNHFVRDQTELMVQVLPEGESDEELSSDDAVVAVRWWDRSRWRLGPRREFLLPKTGSVVDRAQRLERTSGIPAGFLKCITDTSYRLLTELDRDMWQEMTSRYPHMSLRDGDEYIVTDSRFPIRPMTQAKRSALSSSGARSNYGSTYAGYTPFSATSAGSSHRRYREEGLTIKTWKERQADSSSKDKDGGSPDNDGDDGHAAAAAPAALVSDGPLSTAAPRSSRNSEKELEVRIQRENEIAMRQAVEADLEEEAPDDAPTSLWGALHGDGGDENYAEDDDSEDDA